MMGILEDAFDLSKSGGIYFEGARVESLKQYNYLFVGLGGTGADALIRVKNQFHNRMKLPDDPNTGMPIGDIPANVSFLAVDTDESTTRNHYGNTSFADDGSELLLVGANDAAAWQHIIDNMKNEKARGMEYVKWLDPRTTAKGGEAGAGGRRTVGRVGFFHNFDNIKRTINDKLTELSLKNPNAGNVKIFLFTGVSGGTGSGNFIDMAYLLRNIGHVFDASCQLFGYIFMPDVNLFSGGKENDLKSNAFASLLEYDYLEENGKFNNFKFVRSYDPSGVRYSDDYPFDFCHIINLTDVSGKSHSKEDVLTAVSESVFSFVANESGDGHETTPGFKSLYDNIDKYLLSNTLEASYPAFYEYLSIGSSSKKIPYMEINTLIACRMFERLEKSIFSNNVSSESFAQDMNSLGLGNGEDRIQDALTGLLEEKSKPMHNLVTKEYTYDQIWGATNIAYKHAYSDAQQYQDAMNSCAGTAPVDLEDKLRNFIKAAFTDETRGPIYIANLIDGFGKDNLIALFGQKKKYFRDICNDQIVKLSEIKNDLNDIHSEYLALGTLSVGKKNRAVKEYLATLRSWRTTQMNVDKYDNLSELCDNLIKIYTKYYENILLPMKEMLITIKKIFADNLKYLEVKATEAKKEPDKSIIIYPFVFENKYSIQFNQCVDNAEKSFLDELLKNMKSLIRRDIDKVDTRIAQNPDIPGFLSKFVSTCFSSFYQTLTMEDVFSAFLSDGEDISGYSLRVIKDLYNSAFPLFKQSPANYVNTDNVAILSVPGNCYNIVSAAKTFSGIIGDGKLIVKESAEQNSISVVKVNAGYSLYSNAMMEDMEDKYEMYKSSPQQSIYLHLDSEWLKTLPSPVIELSWSGAHSVPRTMDHNKKYRDEFDRCVKKGLIVKDKNVLRADLLEADEEIDIDSVQLVGDLVERTNQYKNLERNLWASALVHKVELNGMGVYYNNGTEDGGLKNIRENIIRFPHLCEKLDRQCKKLDRLEELHKQIEYPMIFAYGLLCDLYKYDKYSDTVYLLHKQNDPIPFSLIKGGEGLINIDVSAPTYYYELYEALYSTLSKSAGQGKTWLEQINANWDAQRRKLIDEKEAAKIKSLLNKYGAYFKRIGEQYKQQSKIMVDKNEKERLENIADLYISVFDAIAITYKKYC